MKKKILQSILSIFILAVVFGINNSFAASNLTEVQAKEILNQIPDEISINIKESEFALADQKVSQQIKLIIGGDVSFYNYIYQYQGYESDPENIDIRKSKVRIFTNKSHVEKDIKVKYSNHSDYNETDKLFVEEKTEGINFDRKWEYEIYSNGTSAEYQDKSKFSWNGLIGTNEISIIEDYTYEDGKDFSHIKKYLLYMFKNDVLYKVVEASKQDVGKIIVPDNIEATDEAYVNYAKPIIEKISNSVEEWDDGNGTVYKYTSELKDIKREYDDFIGFKVTCTYKSFVNDKLNSQADYYQTVLIAKANESMSQLVPVLQNLEIKKKDNKEYIKGTIKITEKDYGYDPSINENYLPKILLIDNNGNKCEANVSIGPNDVFYFETEIDNLEIGKKYVVQACCTDPNNRNSSNNINATIEKNKIISVSNANISIKSSLENDYVKLNVGEKEIDETNLGDINGDGDINARDAKLAIQHFTGKTELALDQINRGDVNKDGDINARDAKLIIQYFTGKITTF